MSKDVPFELLLEDISSYQNRYIRIYLASALTGVPKRLKAKIDRLRNIIHVEAQRASCALFKIYDPSKVTPPGSSHTDEEIFEIDCSEACNSDLLFILNTGPSCGVAIESILGLLSGVPRIFASPADQPVSRMMAGIPSMTVADIRYVSETDFAKQLRKALPEIARLVMDNIHVRRRAVEQSGIVSLQRWLISTRVRQQISRDKLAKQAGTTAAFLKLIETNPQLYMIVSLQLWAQIAGALGGRVATNSLGRVQCIDPDAMNRVTPAVSESLRTLADFVLSTPAADDSIILKLWRDFSEMQNTALAGREQIDVALSYEDWEELYRKWTNRNESNERRLFE